MTDTTTTAAELWRQLYDEAQEHDHAAVHIPGADGPPCWTKSPWAVIRLSELKCPRCGDDGSEVCPRCDGLGHPVELVMAMVDYGEGAATLGGWAGTEDEHLECLITLAEAVRDSPISISDLAELASRVNDDARADYSDTLLRESIAYHAAALAVEDACDGLELDVLDLIGRGTPVGLPPWARDAIKAKIAECIAVAESDNYRTKQAASRLLGAAETFYRQAMEETR